MQDLYYKYDICGDFGEGTEHIHQDVTVLEVLVIRRVWASLNCFLWGVGG